MKYELSLPYLRAFLGVVFIALSLAATVAFLGQGFSGLTFITIVLFVIAIEFVKVLFAGDIGFYLALKQSEKAMFSFAIVFILYVLTVLAETWYLSNGNLNQVAKLETTAARSSGLQQQITAKQAQLEQCNPSHLTKCVNPRTTELAALQSELDKAQAAELSQSELIANQKFWTQIAQATGTSPENLQMGLNVLRSALAEIIGLFLFAQFSTFKRLQNVNLYGRGMHPLTKEEQAENLEIYKARPDIFTGKPFFDKEGYAIGSINDEKHQALLAEIERLKALNVSLEQSAADLEKKL